MGSQVNLSIKYCRKNYINNCQFDNINDSFNPVNGLSGLELSTMIQAITVTVTYTNKIALISQVNSA